MNALLVHLQQKHAYDPSDKSGDYAQVAFIVTVACCGISTLIVLLMIVGVMRNFGGLLWVHLIMQFMVIPTLLALLIIGLIAILTNSAFCYRILNAIPFNEYPGQSTVALPFELTVRVYLVLFVHLVSLILEFYFTVVIYCCQK